jgi:hypothetical protein
VKLPSARKCLSLQKNSYEKFFTAQVPPISWTGARPVLAGIGRNFWLHETGDPHFVKVVIWNKFATCTPNKPLSLQKIPPLNPAIHSVLLL